MEPHLQIANSTAINKYGYRFSVGALTRGVYDECLTGIPFLIGHDASRLLGWSWPLAVHFAPGLARLVSIAGMATNKKDWEDISNRYHHHVHNFTFEGHKDDISELRAQLSSYLTGQEKVVKVESIALVEAGLAKRTFPRLFPSNEKYELISLRELNPVGPGVFQIENLLVFAHSFFRRNLYLLNSLNYPFLEQLQNLKDNTHITVKLALDPDLVGLASTYDGSKLELAYWWGPTFNNDLTSIPSGVTSYEEDDKDLVAFSGISRTEFHWYSQNNEQNLQVEELRNLPMPLTNDEYACRYAHAIIEKDTGHVVHFDGSIRIYSEETMIERLDVDLMHAGRNTSYTKLWRCDGKIDVPLWKRLLSDYFRDNYLIGMYLGEKSPFEKTDSLVIDTPMQEKMVPYSMYPGMGIRVAISYQPNIHNAYNTKRWVEPLDNISDGINTHQYMEPYGIELRKILNRLGTTLHIPQDIKIVTFRDLYANLPLICHHENSLPDSLHQTIQAIKILVESWSERNLDMVLSYKIGYPIDNDRSVNISFLGHIKDIIHWISQPLSTPPIESEDLHDWADDVLQHLSETYPNEYEKPSIIETLKTSGVLFIERQHLPEDWQTKYYSVPEGLAHEIVIPENQGETAKQIINAGLSPALSMVINESRCTKCNQEYFDCACIIGIDNGVAQEITDAMPGRMFFTDRPL